MNGAGVPLVPALLWAQSRRPRSARPQATAASTWASSVTSAVTATASPPGGLDLGDRAASPSREVHHHHPGPSAANSTAVARPIPPPAPVTRATRRHGKWGQGHGRTVRPAGRGF